MKLLPPLPVPIQRSRRLLNTIPRVQAQRACRLPPLLAGARAAQRKRGLVRVLGLPVPEALLGLARVGLGVAVVARLRVEGARVAAQRLRRRDEALGPVADLARGGAQWEEACVLFAVAAQPEELG